MKTTHNMQYVFACLATHSYVIAQVKSKFEEIHRYFNLSPEDEVSLRGFMNSQGEKLLTSAVLMEDKRWREVLPAMKHVTALSSERDLKLYWRGYLSSIKAVENIPESTIIEANSFLNYLLTKYNDASITYEIIKYSLAKNRVLSFDISKIKNSNTLTIPPIKDDYNLYRAILNPSYTLENFNFPISKIINDLAKGNAIDTKRYDCESQNIIFVKSRSSAKVRTLSLNYFGYHFFCNLINSTSLECWKKNMDPAFKSPEDTYHHFIESMIKMDIVILEKIGGTKYVC